MITFVLAVLILKLLVMTLDIVAELPPAEGGQSGSRASGGNSPGHLCRLDSLSHHYSYGRYRCRQPDIDSHQSG